MLSNDNALALLRQTLKQPDGAFNFYLQDNEVTRKDIFKLHLILWLSAPIFKFINIVFISFFLAVAKETSPITAKALLKSLSGSFFLYPILYILISQFDFLRIYFKPIDRTATNSFPPNGVFLISFLPFSASGIFWIFPAPINFILISISFFYSYHLCFYALKNYFGYDLNQFFRLTLVFIIYLLTIALFFTGIYNIIRTLIN